MSREEKRKASSLKLSSSNSFNFQPFFIYSE
nr:MAG TPA: hypothetical protein [Caudoviricetes sp.]